MGRPTKLTENTKKVIVKAISLGGTFRAAANAGGVAYNTFNEWMKKGETAKSGKFAEFYDDIKRSIGLRQARWLAQIEEAAQNGNWQAAAWKLERTEPENFGRTRIEHTGADGGPIVIVEWDEPASKD
jgi:transposase